LPCKLFVGVHILPFFHLFFLSNTSPPPPSISKGFSNPFDLLSWKTLTPPPLASLFSFFHPVAGLLAGLDFFGFFTCTFWFTRNFPRVPQFSPFSLPPRNPHFVCFSSTIPRELQGLGGLFNFGFQTTSFLPPPVVCRLRKPCKGFLTKTLSPLPCLASNSPSLSAPCFPPPPTQDPAESLSVHENSLLHYPSFLVSLPPPPFSTTFFSLLQGPLYLPQPVFFPPPLTFPPLFGKCAATTHPEPFDEPTELYDE